MNDCPDCSQENKLEIDTVTLGVHCLHCHYRPLIENYLYRLSGGKISFVSNGHRGHYNVTLSNGKSVALVFVLDDEKFPRDPEVRIRGTGPAPSSMGPVIETLRKAFKKINITFTQTGIDPEFTTCPLCGSDKFKQKPGHGSLSCVCENLYIGLGDYLTSMLIQRGFSVRNDKEAKKMMSGFEIYESGQKVALIEIRGSHSESVVAIRPVADSLEEYNLTASFVELVCSKIENVRPVRVNPLTDVLQ
jgi:hypothetical protein